MYEIALSLHSYNRYLLLIFLSLVSINSLVKLIKKKEFSQFDNIMSVVLLLSTHIQFFLGIFLYIESPLVIFSSSTMKDPVLRYWATEHFSIMFIAVILITLGRVRSKRSLRKIQSSENDQAGKKHIPHRIVFITHILALILISISLFQMCLIS